VHIEDFDYIVPMADVVHDDLKKSFPSLGEKLMPSWRIDDPYGGDLRTYEETAAKIQKHVEALSVFLKNTRRDH
jgi:protein-tyrosine-phosphatase